LAKLVNIGSLCIDFVYAVPSLVNAGETVASIDRQVFAGGKGLNQSLAAARAGAAVAHYGAVGDDGDMLLQQLAADNVDVQGVLQLAGPSGHAVIQVDSLGQNAIVISGGSNRQIPISLVEQAVGSLARGDWLLLQNEINDVDTIMRLAAEHSVKIAFNVAPPDERIHSYPIELLSLLVVNEPEAMALAGEQDAETAFNRLLSDFPKTSVVLTMGKSGLLCFDADTGAQTRAGAFNVDALDETAAGDAFVGYLMAGLVAGQSLPEALPTASAAGALAVTREGAAPSIPLFEQVEALLGRQKIALEIS
jgi:ribokinase